MCCDRTPINSILDFQSTPNHRLLLGVIMTLIVGALSGCATNTNTASPVVLAATLATNPQPILNVAGYSVNGQSIPFTQIGQGRDTVLILASIHGDEAAGTPLVERLVDELTLQPSHLRGRKVIVVPRVNPDGMVANTRRNARGIDLNRNFPAGNFQANASYGSDPLSEPESRAVLDLINRYQPSRIISLHQPLACIDYDGPGEDLAHTMAAHGPLPVRKLGTRPGSLGAYAGVTMGIPTITLELPRAASGLSPDSLWSKYGPMLLAAIEFAGDSPPIAHILEITEKDVGSFSG